MSNIKLSPDDVTIVNSIEEERSLKAGFPRKLEREVDSWQRLTDQCKQGYDDDVSEYTNDLSSRWMIEEVYDKISETGKDALLKILEPIDTQFEENTIRLKRPIIAYDGINPQKHFWFYRIPKRIKKDELSAFESQYKESLEGAVETF